MESQKGQTNLSLAELQRYLAEYFKHNISANYSSELLKNLTNSGQTQDTVESSDEYLSSMKSLKVFFYCVYILIFVLGIAGNALVCYVVIRNPTMHTVTNMFITNLALSDVLLCLFAVPFTPLYLLTYKEWVFGTILCHLVPFAQGVSVYISAFTLMAIAIDRFFVIIYPFKSRMPMKTCLIIIIVIWLSSCLLTLPYGLFVQIELYENVNFCDEYWPHETSRKAFGLSTSVLQFVIPFIIISFCYTRVCSKLSLRARSMPGAKSARKEEQERERTRKTNRMLISMVVIFGISWLPLNTHNLVQDFYIPAAHWKYSRAFFLLGHLVAMSSTCYNPFLYAWLNENFRKEFKQVLPCFIAPTNGSGSVQRRTAGSGVTRQANNSANFRHNTNGGDDERYGLIARNDTVKEYIPLDGINSSSVNSTPIHADRSTSVTYLVDSTESMVKTRLAQDINNTLNNCDSV